MTTVAPASGVLSMLLEPSLRIRLYALQQLDERVDEWWPELADSLPMLEKLTMSGGDSGSEQGDQGQDSTQQQQVEERGMQVERMAAVVAAKVYYHLGYFKEALSMLLYSSTSTIAAAAPGKRGIARAETAPRVGGEEYFFERYFSMLTASSEVQDQRSKIDRNNDQFYQTLMSHAIDEYVRQRNTFLLQQSKSLLSSPTPAPTEERNFVDERLERIVERIVQFGIEKKQFNQVIGIALESHRIDLLSRILVSSIPAPEHPELTEQWWRDIGKPSLEKVITTIPRRHEREETLRSLISILEDQLVAKQHQFGTVLDQAEEEEGGDQSTVHRFMEEVEGAVFGIYVLLEDAEMISKAILSKRLNSDNTNNKQKEVFLKQAQMCFDLISNSSGNKQLLENVTTKLQDNWPKPSESAADSKDKTPEENNLSKLVSILSGEISSSLGLEFLFRSNHTDFTIVQNVQNSFDARHSILHSAMVVSHGWMTSGSSIDSHLRQNLEWLGKAQNWGKFSATASIGVIHKGQWKSSLKLMSVYLPTAAAASASTASPYSEAGALFALGLIHCDNFVFTTEHRLVANVIRDRLAAPRGGGPNDEVIQHGGCLGLGLMYLGKGFGNLDDDLGSERMDTEGEADNTIGGKELYELLLNVLMSDSAVAGEAAALSIGMIAMGSGPRRSSRIIQELLNYAHETQHEKIIRAIGLALAMIVFGREEEAEPLLEQLTIMEKDPLLRYGGQFALALAYISSSTASSASTTSGADSFASESSMSSSSMVFKRLLHTAVSDVSDDVRRAAVMGLGFIMIRNPDSVSRLVSLLSESYNPHVRYGAAMACGIACAGTAQKDALELLEPLLKDPVDFVRQGALLGMSMILVEQNAEFEPKVDEFRKLLNQTTSNRHEEVLTKVGAILATGIIDAGGRNVTISLQSSSGWNTRIGSIPQVKSVLGMLMFVQHWYWYPFLHFLSLTFQPTALIGLNYDLKMPQFKCKSNVAPSMFAYVPPLKTETKEVSSKLPTVALSTTAKVEKRKKLKQHAVPSSTAPGTTAGGADLMEGVEPTSPVTPSTPLSASAAAADAMMGIGAEEAKKGGEEAKSPTPQPTFEILENPARVLVQQAKYVSFNVDDRYVPVNKSPLMGPGFVMLRDTKADSGQPEPLVEEKKKTDASSSSGDGSSSSSSSSAAARPAPAQEPAEPNPPEPFQWQ